MGPRNAKTEEREKGMTPKIRFQNNVRLAFAAFPDWSRAVLLLYKDQEKRVQEYAEMSQVAQKLGWRLGANREPRALVAQRYGERGKPIYWK